MSKTEIYSQYKSLQQREPLRPENTEALEAAKDCCSHNDKLKPKQQQTARGALRAAEDAAAAAAAEFTKRRREQKASGKLFEDEEFPAIGKNVFSDKSDAINRKYVWKRPNEFCKNPEFITDGISRFDVKQGELGDCWMLAAISSLSMHHKLFEAVVPNGQGFQTSHDYCGMFRFRFWRFGEWKEVVVDDRLPTKNNKLCFMHSQDRAEFWSALLEKAYAKLCGSYGALVGGNQAEAMEDFTGGLCETFDITTAPPNLYDIMFEANSAQSLIGCSIESDDIEGLLDNGLITGHAYSITDVRKCKLIAGGEVTLVRVRNPWGNECEWKGDWSDKSKKWDLVTKGEKNRIQLDVGDDGEFWMAFSDFAEEFNKLEVCHLTPETMSAGLDPEVAKKRRWEMCLESGSWKRGISAGGCRNFIDTFQSNPQFKVEIIDPDKDDDEDLGSIIVGLMQVDVRKLTQGSDFYTIGYCIYKLKDPNCGLLDQRFFKFNKQAAKSDFLNQREVTGRHKLPPGHYVIIPSTYEPNQEAKFILRIFSERPNKSDTIDAKNSMTDKITNEAHLKKYKKVNEEPLRQAFREFAGPAEKIHARQLQKIVNKSFGKELKKFTGFSLEACRSMLALVDANMSGFMEFDEFRRLWNEIRLLKTIFKEHDLDHNGVFDASELRDALKGAGYELCNCVFESLAMRYMDPDEASVSFEDFTLMAIRLKISFETFRAMPKVKGKDNGGDGNMAVVSEDNYLLQTLYL